MVKNLKKMLGIILIVIIALFCLILFLTINSLYISLSAINSSLKNAANDSFKYEKPETLVMGGINFNVHKLTTGEAYSPNYFYPMQITSINNKPAFLFGFLELIVVDGIIEECHYFSNPITSTHMLDQLIPFNETYVLYASSYKGNKNDHVFLGCEKVSRDAHFEISHVYADNYKYEFVATGGGDFKTLYTNASPEPRGGTMGKEIVKKYPMNNRVSRLDSSSRLLVDRDSSFVQIGDADVNLWDIFYEEGTYLSVNSILIGDHLLFYIHKYPKRHSKIPVVHYYMYESNAPWADKVDQSIEALINSLNQMNR